jgi:hypothetical protein
MELVMVVDFNELASPAGMGRSPAISGVFVGSTSRR